MPKMVAVNDKGRRIGESHPRAKMTDHEVELLRDFIDERVKEGAKPMQAYREAAEKFETCVDNVKSIATYRRRAETMKGAKRADTRPVTR